MKNLSFTFLLSFLFFVTSAQSIKDYRIKNNNNSADRTMMLDILRAKMYETYKNEFVFVVNHLKVGNNYAWFKGEVQRKDGGSIRLGDGEDCCHVEALLKKSNGKWYIVESAAFSTDLWYDGIENRYPKAPYGIFN